MITSYPDCTCPDCIKGEIARLGTWKLVFLRTEVNVLGQIDWWDRTTRRVTSIDTVFIELKRHARIGYCWKME